MADLDPKGKGDNSMPGNHRSCSDVWDGAVGDPRDMAKAGLLEAQSPAVNVRTRRNDAWNRCRVVSRHEPVGRDSLRDAERRSVRAVKEMRGRPTPCSIRTTRTYHGIAYGARVLGRRSARSSRRSHDLPGRPGKPDRRAKGHR